MDIDWDNSPEWAEVYIIDTIGGHAPGFHKSKGNAWEDASGKFWEKGLSYLKVIPRPTKPAAPEWKGWGIPPVGKEVEYESLHDWWAVKITAVGEKHILMNYGGVEICRCIQDSRFRLIRPKEQQERDALIEIILTDGDLSAGMLADVILSRYNLEPKP